MDVFLDVGGHGLGGLAAPSDGIADAPANEVGRYIAELASHGRLPVRIEPAQGPLQLVCQSHVAFDLQPAVLEHPVIAQSQGREGHRPAAQGQGRRSGRLATDLNRVGHPLQSVGE